MDVVERARMHAALGEPIRLAIVDDLATSDRSPGELARRHGLPTNLLAHHLSVLDEAGLIERVVSSGDGRRRYVRLRRERLPSTGRPVDPPTGPVLFVCTHNSARSQLAAALWSERVGPAVSAGTHPADRVHEGAVAAAERAGLDLSAARPHSLEEIDVDAALIVTVCDRAHEELTPAEGWWHWSTPDPVEDPSGDAFDRTLERLRERVASIERGRG
jgi:protein-tyrosine-phosphatase